MTNTDTLTTIKTQILSNIEDVTLNPKPNYNIDGQSISWSEYLKSLFDSLAMVNQQLVIEAGPFELESRGTS